ncbi:MAG: helix-turn-helix domain-containing protein [Saprospiraceae bacterium]|nr:helix-turn-helix domain-containing protein [Saprospiraceae bacterium]
MDGYRLQIILFDLIRERINDSKHWIDEIAEQLNLSKSAVYKKVNATSSLSLEELSDLLVTYDISFDDLIRPEKTTVTFSSPYMNRRIKSFLDYFNPLKQSLEFYSRLPNVEVNYATHELPIFYWLTSRDVCYFKLYAFARTLWELDGYKDKPFDLSEFSGEQVIMKEAREIAEYFFTMPSTEFWNQNILGNTLNQIKYFANSGLFANMDDAIHLCQSLKDIIVHIREMASEGKKFFAGQEAGESHADFNLYHNEIAHTNNTILVESDTVQAVFATYDSPNFIVSQDETLIDHTKEWYDKLRRHSLPVSNDASKNRLYLFDQILKRISMTQTELETLKKTGEAFSV